MKQAQIERRSIRTAVVLGFCLTLGLWLYTGFAFTQRIEAMQREAADVASRYTRAQELLSTVRAQVLLSSVRVRDALLEPRSRDREQYWQQVEASYRLIKMAIADYEPVIGFSALDTQLTRLNDALERCAQSEARFQRASGPMPMRKSAGTMSGAKTVSK